jgi:hypothetical protein
VNSALTRIVEDENNYWMMKPFHYSNRMLRQVAAKADEQMQRKGAIPDKLEDAARILNRCFRITISDRTTGETSRKWGAIEVTNNLFKIYFEVRGELALFDLFACDRVSLTLFCLLCS